MKLFCSIGACALTYLAPPAVDVWWVRGAFATFACEAVAVGHCNPSLEICVLGDR